MATRSGVLITADDLLGRIGGGEPITLLDVRWQLAEPDGRAAYLSGHLPGAVYVSLEDELSDHTVSGRGRHPLPSGVALTEAARRWGVRDGRPVVVYDDWNRAGSARAWWVLRAAGLTDVRILDGGLAAWRAAGGPLESGAVDPEPGDVTLPHDDLYRGAMPTLSADDVDTVLLLDARAPERYRGDVEPVDPVAGHIPGAKNLPSTAVLDAAGTFLPDDAIDEQLAQRGVIETEPVGVYCGSGVTAAVAIAAVTALGRTGALFPGSWSQWSSDAGRAVARGAE